MTDTRSLQRDLPIEGADVGAIFKAHNAFVWRVLRYLGVATADQEDVLQEVFVVVHRRLPDYREQDKMRTWLYAIATRVVLDYRRRTGRRREELTEVPEVAHDAQPQREAADPRAVSMARRMLAALPEKQRVVFVLHEIEQLSMSEIAAAVECPLPTAYARLRKARERLLSEVARARLRGEMP